MAAVAEAYRNLSCVGAEPVAVTDCLNFGNPEKLDAYYQLAECIEGMAEACEIFGTPVVSGNVSLYNETEQGAIYPTPTVGMVGVFEDVSRHATPAFKREGDMVVFFGGSTVGSSVSPLAASEYLAIVHGEAGRASARLDLELERWYGAFVRYLIRTGLVDTVHDVSGGGVAVALAEMALAGGIGMVFDSTLVPERRHGYVAERLFGEGGGGYLISFPEDRWEEVQEALHSTEPAISFPYDQVARTFGDRFEIGDLIDLSLDDLRTVYERDLFEQHAPQGGHLG
jgi:phosphoribosylformylglycinamidine synthase